MKIASSSFPVLVLALTGAFAAGACSRSTSSTSESSGAAASTRAGAAPNEKFPEPRWPSYFKPPKSVDDLMPAARQALGRIAAESRA